MDCLISDFLLYWFGCRLRKGERGNYIGILEIGSPGGSALIKFRRREVSLVSCCANKTLYVGRSYHRFHKDQSKSEKILPDLV